MVIFDICFKAIMLAFVASVVYFVIKYNKSIKKIVDDIYIIKNAIVNLKEESNTNNNNINKNVQDLSNKVSKLNNIYYIIENTKEYIVKTIDTKLSKNKAISSNKNKKMGNTSTNKKQSNTKLNTAK